MELLFLKFYWFLKQPLIWMTHLCGTKKSLMRELKLMIGNELSLNKAEIKDWSLRLRRSNKKQTKKSSSIGVELMGIITYVYFRLKMSSQDECLSQRTAFHTAGSHKVKYFLLFFFP